MRARAFASLASGAVLSLAACASKAPIPPAPVVAATSATDWSARHAEIEWWYVALLAPEDGIAVHAAAFAGRIPGCVRLLDLPLRRDRPTQWTATHLGITDLRADAYDFRERGDLVPGGGPTHASPLSVRSGDWSLVEADDGRSYSFAAGPVRATLVPTRPATIHPPGLFGDDRLGRLGYQSITRLTFTGTVRGRPVRGLAWMDHQWGDADPGRTLAWDWFGLHASDGTDVMLFRMRSPADGHEVLAGTRTDAAGRSVPLEGLRIEPLRTWVSPTGRAEYAVQWRLRADSPAFDATLSALRDEQEVVSWTGALPYWEGPMSGSGTLDGKPVSLFGMGEFVPAAPRASYRRDPALPTCPAR